MLPLLPVLQQKQPQRKNDVVSGGAGVAFFPSASGGAGVAFLLGKAGPGPSCEDTALYSLVAWIFFASCEANFQKENKTKMS